MSKPDPHGAWLNELRRRSVRISSGLQDDQPGTVPGLQDQITALREWIIDTAPTGKSGVLAQVDLLKDLAWSDPVRRLACKVKVAEQLINLLAMPFDVEGHHIVVGVSIGIAFAPCDGDQIGDLFRKADLALYCAKCTGRSSYHFFNPDAEVRSKERLAFEEDLRYAIHDNKIRLHYQPQISLRTGRIVGFEALLRWHHPRFGHMPPREVLALAEETGLIMPLGFWGGDLIGFKKRHWKEQRMNLGD